MDDNNQNNQFTQNPNGQMPSNQPFPPQQPSAPRTIMPPADGQGINAPRPDDPPKPRPVANVDQVYNIQPPMNPPAPTPNPAINSTQNSEPITDHETTPLKPEKPIRYDGRNALILAVIALIMQIPPVMIAIGNMLSAISVFIALPVVVALRIIPVVGLARAIIVLLKTKKTKSTPASVIPVVCINAVATLIIAFVFIMPLISASFQAKTTRDNVQLTDISYSLSKAVTSYRRETNKVPTSLSDIKPYLKDIDDVDNLEIKIIQAQSYPDKSYYYNEGPVNVNAESGTFTIIIDALCGEDKEPKYFYHEGEGWNVVFTVLQDKTVQCVDARQARWMY